MFRNVLRSELTFFTHRKTFTELEGRLIFDLACNHGTWITSHWIICLVYMYSVVEPESLQVLQDRRYIQFIGFILEGKNMYLPKRNLKMSQKLHIDKRQRIKTDYIGCSVWQVFSVIATDHLGVLYNLKLMHQTWV